MAINRYDYTEVAKDSIRGIRNYMTTIFPSIPISQDDVYIVTRDGDRLDLIADRFYQDSTLWWVIAVSNNLSDSMYIPAGTKLRLPVDILFALNFTKLTNDAR